MLKQSQVQDADILSQINTKAVALKSEKKTLLNNRYYCDKELGKGGLSIVYEGSDTYAKYFNDNKKLAIKVPSKSLLKMKDIAAFVYSEYRILQQLQHDNIVKVYDFGIDEVNAFPYIVLEKLEGQLLMDVSLHSMSKKIKKKLFFSLYGAIEYMHEKGVIHADINPNNIMVLDDGTIRLFDFGISQTTGTKKRFNLAFKKVNAYNPRYSAPEVLDGEVPTRKSDLFSLACVMFEVYTHELPFKVSSQELKDKPLTRSQLMKVPLRFRSWFKNALQVHISERNVTPFQALWIQPKMCKMLLNHKK